MRTAEEILQEKEREIISVPKTTTINNALKIMVEKKIGAMLVKENDDIVGIWTERDLMRNLVTDGFDPETAEIGNHMSTNLQFVANTDSVYALQDKFLGMRLRHLLVKKGDSYIGMLSIGDVIRAILIDKTTELENLNAKYNWEYYEDWKFKNK